MYIIHTYTHKCVYICVYIYIYTYMCIYIYMFISYVFVYAYVYIYIYILQSNKLLLRYNTIAHVVDNNMYDMYVCVIITTT